VLPPLAAREASGWPAAAVATYGRDWNAEGEPVKRRYGYKWGFAMMIDRPTLDAFQDLCRERGETYGGAIRRLIEAEVAEAEPKPSERSERLWRRRLSRARAGIPALLLALASPLAAQEPEPPAPSLADYISPAAWCPLRSGSEPSGFGCDGGLAFSLIDRSIGERYTAVGVAFVGAETVGLGVAWCRGRLCAGAGVAATRDDFGIELDSASPVIGATFSLGGLRE